jgi:hypothetical protein
MNKITLANGNSLGKELMGSNFKIVFSMEEKIEVVFRQYIAKCSKSCQKSK